MGDINRWGLDMRHVEFVAADDLCITDAQAHFQISGPPGARVVTFSHLLIGLLRLDTPALILMGTEHLDEARAAEDKARVLAQIAEWEAEAVEAGIAEGW